jgi:Flp pilus assembly protein TadG
MASLIKRLRGETGAELIEFAIVFPIFLVIFAAMIDFGFLLQRYEVVTNAAREGARIGVLPGYGTADIQNRVQSYLTASGLTASYPTPAVTYTSETLPSGLTVNEVQVIVTYPSSFFFMGPFAGMIGGAAPGTLNLRAVSIMRVEQAGAAAGS